MWIPETLLVSFGVSWPSWLETLAHHGDSAPMADRAGGPRAADHARDRLAAGVLIGMLSVVVFFIMFLAFMR